MHVNKRENMKYKLFVMAAISCFALRCEIVPAAQSQNDEGAALSSFKIVVSNYEKFFSLHPGLLSKVKNSYSRTGAVFSYKRYEASSFSYDVRKSDSLVSPFIGYITMPYKYWSNGLCGDYVPDKVPTGYTLQAEAVSKKNDEACYEPASQGPDTAEFVFAFQDGKWTLKGVTSKINFRSAGVGTMAAALGVPAKEDSLQTDDIGTWKQLLPN